MKKNIFKCFVVLICGVLALSSCVREEDYPEKIVGEWELTEFGDVARGGGDTTIYVREEHQGLLRIQLDGTKIRSYGGVRGTTLKDEDEYFIAGDQLSLRGVRIITGRPEVNDEYEYLPYTYSGPFTIESLTSNKLVLRTKQTSQLYYKFKRF